MFRISVKAGPVAVLKCALGPLGGIMRGLWHKSSDSFSNNLYFYGKLGGYDCCGTDKCA
jgi:hypothetical protein